MDGPTQKLRRANIHLNAFQRSLKRFMDRKPHEISHKVVREDDGSYGTIYVSRCDPIPDSMALIVGDICNNLRSVLDHILWQLWLKADSTFDQNVTFPIFADPNRFKREAARHIEGLDAVQRTLIANVQPYRRGNDLLSVLRELNDADKHRLITIVRAMAQYTNIHISGHFIIPPKGSIKIYAPAKSGLEYGTELLRYPLEYLKPGAEAAVDANFNILIVFGEFPNIAEGRIVGTTLRAIRDEVTYVLDRFREFL